MGLNIYLILFIVVAIATIFGGTFKIYKLDMTIAAFLFFVGAVAAFVIYGLRWFGANGAFSQTPVSWPPTINTCPDYLTYVARKTPTGVVNSCIDTVGVSKNGKLPVFPKDVDPTTAGDSKYNKYFIALTTTHTDPAGKILDLCNLAMPYQLTWEGVTDGQSCFTPNGSPAGADGNSSGGCPVQN
jgi:hypothetical protein